MANWQLSFEHLQLYDAGELGIKLPIHLRIGEVAVSVDAKLDTGSSDCVFERSYGEALGLAIEQGYPVRISTAIGSFPAYGHSVTLTIAEYEFDAVVYFAQEYAMNRNVLGRHGFLNRLQLGLIDYDGKLFLSHYDSIT